MSSVKSAVTPLIRYPQKPKIKYVKKAGMWCKTYFEYDRNNKATQKQEWTMDKPSV